MSDININEVHETTETDIKAALELVDKLIQSGGDLWHEVYTLEENPKMVAYGKATKSLREAHAALTSASFNLTQAKIAKEK